jgi:hypothetical protein
MGIMKYKSVLMYDYWLVYGLLNDLYTFSTILIQNDLSLNSFGTIG